MSDSRRIVVPTDDSAGQSGVWLLDLDVGGRVERFALAEYEITSETGEVLRYRGGLAPLVRSLGTGGDQQGITIDDNVTDWSELEARGQAIDWSSAVLRWWYPGQLLEQVVSVMSGVVVASEYAHPDAPTRLVATLDSRAAVRATPYPDGDAVIDATSWTHTVGVEVIGSKSFGMFPPTVIGYPGSGDTPWSEPTPAVPAFLVSCDGTTASKMLIGFDATLDAATVWSFDVDGSASFALTEVAAVATSTDLEGRGVTYADFDAGVVLPIEDHEYAVAFNNDTGYGGGILWRGSVLRGLGDVLLWALEKSGVPFDADLQEGQAAKLNEYKLDTYIGTQQLDMERWIETSLVPLFPLRRMRSGRGLWYRFVDWRATAESAVAWLDVEAGQLTPTSAVQTLGNAVYNKATLEYALNVSSGAYMQRQVIDAERPSLYTERYIQSPECRASQALRGVLERPPVRTPLLWSDTTAAAVLQSWVARDAHPLQGRGYEGRQLDRLLPGDVVVVSDARARMVERVALVDDVRIGGARTGIDVVFLPSLARLTT